MSQWLHVANRSRPSSPLVPPAELQTVWHPSLPTNSRSQMARVVLVTSCCLLTFALLAEAQFPAPGGWAFEQLLPKNEGEPEGAESEVTLAHRFSLFGNPIKIPEMDLEKYLPPLVQLNLNLADTFYNEDTVEVNVNREVDVANNVDYSLGAGAAGQTQSFKSGLMTFQLHDNQLLLLPDLPLDGVNLAKPVSESLAVKGEGDKKETKIDVASIGMDVFDQGHTLSKLDGPVIEGDLKGHPIGEAFHGRYGRYPQGKEAQDLMRGGIRLQALKNDARRRVAAITKTKPEDLVIKGQSMRERENGFDKLIALAKKASSSFLGNSDDADSTYDVDKKDDGTGDKTHESDKTEDFGKEDSLETMSGLLMTVPNPTEMLDKMPEFQDLDKLLPPIFDLDIAVIKHINNTDDMKTVTEVGDEIDASMEIGKGGFDEESTEEQSNGMQNVVLFDQVKVENEEADVWKGLIPFLFVLGTQ